MAKSHMPGKTPVISTFIDVLFLGTSGTGSQGCPGRLQVSGPLSFVWMTSGPFPSAPFFSSFWRRGQRHRQMCLARSPMVHGCSWWSPMNLRQVLPFIFNSYFCCFLNCGLTVLFIQHSKGVFVFFLTLSEMSIVFFS